MVPWRSRSAASDATRDGTQTSRVGAFILLASGILVVTGCSSPWPGAADPEPQPGELAQAGGRPCPERLPIGDDPSGHGFGPGEPAGERPALHEPREAWVCRYDPVEAATAAGGGTVFEWRRAGKPEPLATAELPDLRDALDDLAPADRSDGCNGDLGPRWMVAYSHGGDLTGVVVDDYGCRDVRLTDDPHSTPPGAGGQEGTVGGVLDGGAGILDVLDIGASD